MSCAVNKTLKRLGSIQTPSEMRKKLKKQKRVAMAASECVQVQKTSDNDK